MGVVGPFHVVALVLVVSGVAKLASPGAAAAMLSSLAGRTVPDGAGRAVGVVELGVGSAALGGSTVAAIVLAAAYTTFALVAEVARRRGVPSCGCFGAALAPPGVTHVLVDAVSAGVALAAALGAADRSIDVVWRHGAVVALGTGAALAAAVAMLVATETVRGEVVAARRAIEAAAPARAGGRGR